MKKTLLFMCFGLFVSGTACAQDVVKLPPPDVMGGLPLMQAMNERKTDRVFSSEPLDNQTLSDILWAAWGYNRPDKRTIPTAKNRQKMDVYVLKSDGAWIYDAKNNALVPVVSEDLRPLAARGQDFVTTAPVTLLFVADEDDDYSMMHAGSAYQNVGLYCASKGLGNVVRGMIDRKKLAQALSIVDDDDIIISQTIGKK